MTFRLPKSSDEKPPEDFLAWRGDERDAWFAEGARLYRDKCSKNTKPNGRKAKRSGNGAADSNAGRNVPVIELQVGRPDLMASQAEDAILKSGLPVFQRSFKLFRPATEHVKASRGRNTTTAILQQLQTAIAIDILAQVSDWRKFNVRANGLVSCEPSELATKILLGRAGQWRFPRVTGITTTPTLRPDGSILSEPGYDQQTGLYFAADYALSMPAIAERPTKEDAEEALADLMFLLNEFGFVDDDGVSLSVALSGLITPVLRGALSVAPLHAVTAPDFGHGKSYLWDLAAAICIGQFMPALGYKETENEMEKTVASYIWQGSPVFSLDNVNGVLRCPLIAQAVERPVIGLRKLGTDDNRNVENTFTIFANGCNFRVEGDLVRRTLRCRLDRKEENATEHVYARDPFGMILADRGRYIGACMTIARAYLAAGAPNVNAKPFASFEDYSRFVRKPLLWLGCADPVRSIQVSKAEDTTVAAHVELMGAWRARRLHPCTASELIGEAEVSPVSDPRLREAIVAVAGDRQGRPDPKRLGTWLGRHVDKIASGMRIHKGKNVKGGYPLWQIEEG